MINLEKIKIVLSAISIICLFLFSDIRAYAFEHKQETGYKVGNYYWIIYDDKCPYCIRTHRKIKLLDWGRKFKFTSFRDSHTYDRFPYLSKEECSEDIHMITPKGEVLKGYDVFKTVINLLLPLKIIKPVFKTQWGENKLHNYYKNIVQKRACYYNAESCY